MLHSYKYQLFVTFCGLENFQVCDMLMDFKIKYAMKKRYIYKDIQEDFVLGFCLIIKIQNHLPT